MEKIRWSLMHPTRLSTEYMKRVVREARRYDFDAFEICGPFASPVGGMNGLTCLEHYPAAHRCCDCEQVEKQRRTLNSIVKLAHSIKRPVYYWHREIMMPRGMLEDCPGLMDENGEFDLLGEDFLNFLRYKIGETFRHVPDLDGIVLTLTEADYSVIHNSCPDRYPPAQVVSTIISVFAEEHQKRGRHFILRSFGSVAADYQDILDGAALAARKYSFEIETKIVPYDFIPFLPPNPFLKVLPGTTLCAECDCLGEYLGAGYLPACSVQDIHRYVREAQAKGVTTYAIRLDRIGNSIFDSSHEINLYAYTRFIRDRKATPEQVMAEYAAMNYPQCREEMTGIQKAGLECVTHINFLNHNVVFHKFPIQPDFKWIKAGGCFSVYRDGFDLHLQHDCWGIRSGEKTPGRKNLLEEKRLACRLAKEGLAMLQEQKDLLPAAEYGKHLRAWQNAVKVSAAMEAYTRSVAAYFADMEAMADPPAQLQSAVCESRSAITALMDRPDDPLPPVMSCCDGAPLPGDDLDLVYFAPLRFLCGELLKEYSAEFSVRRELLARKEVSDFIVPGGLYDDIRAGRAMHASHSYLQDGHPVREAGNTVFPNGTVTMELDAAGCGFLEIVLEPDFSAPFTVWLDGRKQVVVPEDRVVRLKLEKPGKICLRIGKDGVEYPRICSVACIRKI